MKYTFSQIGVFVLISLAIYSCKSNSLQSVQVKDLNTNVETNKYDKATRMDLAMEQEIAKTKDPALGYVPRERLATALEYTLQLQAGQEKLHKAAIPGITWEELGPTNVGGRTRAIMFDPNDATHKRVFAAGITGGLWVNEDIYSSNQKWDTVNNFFSNLGISCLTYDPMRPDTMYFGTGEGYYNGGAVQGDGIYRSFDGGNTWTQIVTGSSSFKWVQRMVVASNGDVFASTRDDGVHKSTNQGASWTKVLGAGVGGGSINRANDLDFDASGNLYATLGLNYNRDGIYKTTNGGTSWTKVSNNTGFPAAGFYRIELACAPSNANIVYALLQDTISGGCSGFYRSFDAGNTWSVGTMARTLTDSATVGGSQAWYDLYVTVDPKNEGTVLIGGIDLYKSTNYGSGWTQLSQWYGAGGLQVVHSDQHIIVYKPNSSDTVLFGQDGGIYMATNMTGSHVFTTRNSGYNVTQFYSCALHPEKAKPYALGGTQDNGSHKFTNAGLNQTTQVTGGDGAFVHIDQSDPNYQFTSYIYNQYRRSTDGGATFSSSGLNFSSSDGMFINPTDYDNSLGKMYCSWASGQYLVWHDARSSSGTYRQAIGAGFNGVVSAVRVDENTAKRVWFGTETGRIYYVDNADLSGTPSVNHVTSSPPSGWPTGSYVSSIEIEKGKPTHILVTFSNYGVNSVWESTNTGSSWTNVEGNLPDMPIRWAMFSPLGGDSALLATEVGVWSTTDLNGASTNWQPTNTGLANVRTDMLQTRSSDSVVLAATHGRGLYRTKYFSKLVEARMAISDSIVYAGDYVNFSDDSYGVSGPVSWDMDNDGITDTTGTNVSWAWATGGYKTVTQTINGSSTNTQVIHVLPKLGTPYTTTNGGDFESNTWHFAGTALTGGNGQNLWEHGVPGASTALKTMHSPTKGWKTLLNDTVPSAKVLCALYTPSFNMTKTATYTLSFYLSMAVYYCNYPYAVQIQYSTNKGASWSALGDENSSGSSNWQKASNNGCPPDASLFSNQIGWIGNYSNALAYSNISYLQGNADVRFRFVYSSADAASFLGSVYKDGFMIDDFTITTSSSITNEPAIPVETALCSRTIALPANDSAYFYSPNGKIMGVVRNLSAHDFGNTTMTIDQAGTTPVDFDTVTAVERRRLAKTVKITPTTNNTGAKVEIQMFYDKTTEIDAWKTVTSNSAKNIQLFKSPNGIGSATIANSVYGDSTVIDSVYGANGVRIVARFNNGFSGVGSGGGGGGTPGPLPVTWVSINGKRLTDKVELTFQTGSEINNSHFDIERRGFNATEEFSAVGNVKGKGNYNGLSTYLFDDKDPKALENTPLFYRVKQVDFDGKFDYSDVVFIAPSNLSNKNIIVYPLPVKETLNIDVNIDHIGLIANVYDMQGRLIATHQLKNKSTKISTNELIAGQYLLIVTDGRQVFYNDKIIKN